MPSKSRPAYRAYQDLAQALKRKAKRNQAPCWICHKSIDYDLHWKHPMSYTYDHDTPLAHGGDPRGTGKPAHRSCNSRRGAGRSTPLITATNIGYNYLTGPRTTNKTHS